MNTPTSFIARGVVTRFKEPKTTKPVFTIEELRTILDDKNRGEPFWLPFVLSIYCGGRISEIMHLEWQDIKWQEKRIHIRIKPQYRLKMKTERYAPLPDELEQILRPMAKPHGWIVDDRARTSAKSWRWFFMKMLRAADIQAEGRSPHSTRHTWAALSIATGVDSAQVMEEAGHSNITTTMRYIKCASFYREAVKEWERGEFNINNFMVRNTTIIK